MIFQWLYAHSVMDNDLASNRLALKSLFHSTRDAFLSQTEIIIGLLALLDYV